MQIIKVTDKTIADLCDEMLTSLIREEKEYDENISDDVVIRDWYSTTLANKNRVTFAAIEQEEVIGFIHGYIKDKAGMFVNNTVVLLDAIFVKEKSRNQGLGTALVEEFKKWSISVGAKYIDLKVLTDNRSAIKFYENHGFTPLKSCMRNVIKK